ncbi:MAG: LacI family DNA-binding transcriptional regulator [Opitutales bacterium]|nr:LacI family DNA-binding transcriptional regulator [Opitutales bacterium]
MDASKRRITLKDVAREAGVSVMTASYALRNHPATAAATRQRVKAVAEKIGYRPDPVLGALTAYRTRAGGKRLKGVIGVLVDQPPRQWEALAFGAQVMSGLRQRAEELGYTVEYFETGGGMSAKRTTSVLRSRGVRGLIVAAPAAPGACIELGWEHFCAVGIGRSLDSPLLDYVSANQYESGLRIMSELAARGYRRAGFVSPMQVDERIGHRFLAAYFVSQQELYGAPALVPPLLDHANEADAVSRWLRLHKPDAVISDDAVIHSVLRRIGLRVPRDIGVAVTRLMDIETELSGIVPRLTMIGAKSVEFLHAKLLTGDTGVPEERTGSVISGYWHEGATLRSRSAAE